MPQDELSNAMLYSKSADWGYEQEWRMVIAGANQNFDSDVCGVVNMPDEVIREIYLGLNVSEEIRASAVAMARKNKWIQLFQCELHSETYSLLLRTI
ncbi:hypothetical protein LJC46_04900 [Desulfovibrio sp. OttesenSCG-928-G15]|nr:hypothetical protein [Desulfovibrio sp. OttesenSCG-928-G15]